MPFGRFYRLRSPLFLAAVIPLVAVSADLAVRGKDIWALPYDFKAYYAVSVLASWALWYQLFYWRGQILARGKSLLAAFVMLLAAAGFAGAFIGSLAFYSYFRALPNLFIFEYVFGEPRDCLAYAKSELTSLTGFAFAAIVALLCLFIHHATIPHVKRRSWLSSSLHATWLAGVLLFLHNNVRMGPDAFLPDIHAVFSLTKAAESALNGRRQVQVVGAGIREEVRESFGTLPHHVLLILNESIRAQNQSAFGYDRDTTPELRAFFEERAASVVRFEHGYANATRTMMAFPAFFTGVIPSQSGDLMHRKPLVFDYAKAFSNASTFLISSQSMHWGNFDKFLAADSLDFVWYKEKSPHDKEDDGRYESLDDRYLPEAFEEYLQALPKGRRAFGVIQLTGTHAPYRFDAASEKWRGARLTSDYDNSLHYHDHQVGRILAALKKRGMLDDTLIISTSDHGEAFGEHGYSGHMNTFFEEEARVPFWIHLPRAIANSASVMAQMRANAKLPVSNADIVPTTLSLITGKAFRKAQKYLSGLTGSPLDRVLDPDRVVLMQNYNDVDEKTMFIGLGAVVGSYKYLLKFNRSRGEEQIYNLVSDPGEKVDLWRDKATQEVKKQIVAAILKNKNSKRLYEQAVLARKSASNSPRACTASVVAKVWCLFQKVDGTAMGSETQEP